MLFVQSRERDKEKILSPHEESNLRPSDSALLCSTTEPQRLHGKRGLLRSSKIYLIIFKIFASAFHNHHGGLRKQNGKNLLKETSSVSVTPMDGAVTLFQRGSLLVSNSDLPRPITRQDLGTRLGAFPPLPSPMTTKKLVLHGVENASPPPRLEKEGSKGSNFDHFTLTGSPLHAKSSHDLKLDS